MIPKFITRKWAPQDAEAAQATGKEDQASDSDDPEIRPPLRALTSIRGSRVRNNFRTGWRAKMHDAKVRAKDKMHHDHAETNGKESEVKA